MFFMEALSYPYNSRDLFSKLLLGFILMVIPFGSIFLMGYGVSIIHSVSYGERDLPDFDLGGDFGRGVTILLGSIVYFAPVLIIYSIFVGLLQNSGMTEELFRNVEMVRVVGLLAIVGILFVGAIFMIGVIRFSVTGESGTLFQFTENFAIASENPGKIAIFMLDLAVLLVIVLIGAVIGSAFFFIPGLIIGIAGAYFSPPFLYAQLGSELGLVGKMKRKVQEY